MFRHQTSLRESHVGLCVCVCVCVSVRWVWGGWMGEKEENEVHHNNLLVYKLSQLLLTCSPIVTTRCFSTSALPRQNQHGPRGAGGCDLCSPLSLACLLGFGSIPPPSSRLLTSWRPLLSSCLCFLFFPAARALGSKKKFCSEESSGSLQCYGQRTQCDSCSDTTTTIA